METDIPKIVNQKLKRRPKITGHVLSVTPGLSCSVIINVHVVANCLRPVRLAAPSKRSPFLVARRRGRGSASAGLMIATAGPSVRGARDHSWVATSPRTRRTDTVSHSILQGQCPKSAVLRRKWDRPAIVLPRTFPGRIRFMLSATYF